MSPSHTRSRAASLHFRVDPALKAAFTAATQARDKPAAEVVREFMRAYVERSERPAFEDDARRRSRLIAQAARNPASEKARVMREIEVELPDPAFWRD